MPVLPAAAGAERGGSGKRRRLARRTPRGPFLPCYPRCTTLHNSAVNTACVTQNTTRSSRLRCKLLRPLRHQARQQAAASAHSRGRHNKVAVAQALLAEEPQRRDLGSQGGAGRGAGSAGRQAGGAGHRCTLAEAIVAGTMRGAGTRWQQGCRAVGNGMAGSSSYAALYDTPKREPAPTSAYVTPPMKTTNTTAAGHRR